MGILNVKCKIINTENYSVDFGVLDLFFGVIFLIPNKLVRPVGSKNKRKTEDGTENHDFR